MYRKLVAAMVVLFSTSVLGLVACVPSDTQATVSPLQSQGSITVVWRGESYGQPDEAIINVGVDTFAATVSEATVENETILQAVLTTLQDKGISAKDIQTSNYSLFAEQIYGDRGPEGIAGYRVANQVRVLLRDIGQVSEILTAVTEAGANSIYGVTFAVSDTAGLEAEAREKASADARARAESLASLSGVTLGAIHTISEVTGQYPLPYVEGLGGGLAMAQPASSEVSIAPGQLGHSVAVEVTFIINGMTAQGSQP